MSARIAARHGHLASRSDLAPVPDRPPVPARDRRPRVRGRSLDRESAGRAARAVSRGLSAGSGTRLPSDQAQRAPRSGACGERPSPYPGKGVSLASLRSGPDRQD